MDYNSLVTLVNANALILETSSMSVHWPISGALLALAMFASAALRGQDTEEPKPALPPKQSAPKEVTLKGALTALEQEVSHTLPLKKDQSYLITAESPGFFTQVRIQDSEGKQLSALSGTKTFKAPDDGVF